MGSHFSGPSKNAPQGSHLPITNQRDIKGKKSPQKPFINTFKRKLDSVGEPVNPLCNIQMAECVRFLVQEKARYKVLYGGRGGVKSWGCAQSLLLLGMQRPLRILCAREFQTSIEDSVKSLLDDLIAKYDLGDFYTSYRNRIEGKNGTSFKFTGLRINITELKSFEGADICWVEEAQRVSAASWDILIPTIRRSGSEIWVTFNPENETDPTYQRFVLKNPPSSIVKKVGFLDNPWFPDVLEDERRFMLETDPEAYAWIWGGECRKISDAIIFKNRFTVCNFETPPDAKFRHGCDWGFGPDPTTAVRCFVQEKDLYVDYEAYGFNWELDNLARHFAVIPHIQKARLWADNSRPETIRHVKKLGLDCRGAKKWKGSIEDGIAYLKSFRHIYIHERCKHTAQEFALYAYKTDRVTGEVIQPYVIVDKHNHCIDALRYAQNGYIGGRGKNLFSKMLARRLAHGL